MKFLLPGSIETDMNQSGSPRNHKNQLVTRVPRLRASPRHGGAGRFQHLLSLDAPAVVQSVKSVG